MPNRILSALEVTVSKYGAIIPIIVAVMPVVISAIMILYYTGSDTTLASYVLQEVGIVNIWTKGLLMIVAVFIQGWGVIYTIGYWLDIRKLSEYKLYALIAVSLLLLAVASVIMIIIWSLAALAILHQGRKKSEEEKKNMKTVFKMDNSIAVFIFFGFFALISFPLNPVSKLTLNNGGKREVVPLVKKDMYYLVQDKTTGKVEQIKTDSIVKDEICSPYDVTFLTYSIVYWVTSSKAHLEKC